MTYQLLDSGDEKKFERFGEYSLIRPCAQAIWRKEKEWKGDAEFTREQGWRGKVPKEWTTEISGVKFKIAPTDFGHVGAFPEHAALWESLREVAEGANVLNLFAYSGGATLGLAKAGARVCHLDASKGMVDWARENASLNGVSNVRWIVDDAMKFLKREEKRESRYEGILLDPPTFGRGSKGEVFKIERDLMPLLEACRNVLSKKARFVVLSCHTPGITPLVLEHVVGQIFTKTNVETGEMMLPGDRPIPSGSFAKIRL